MSKILWHLRGYLENKSPFERGTVGVGGHCGPLSEPESRSRSESRRWRSSGGRSSLELTLTKTVLISGSTLVICQCAHEDKRVYSLRCLADESFSHDSV